MNSFRLSVYMCLTMNIHTSILKKDIVMKFSMQVYCAMVLVTFQKDKIIHFKIAALKLHFLSIFVGIIKNNTRNIVLF